MELGVELELDNEQDEQSLFIFHSYFFSHCS